MIENALFEMEIRNVVRGRQCWKTVGKKVGSILSRRGCGKRLYVVHRASYLVDLQILQNTISFVYVYRSNKIKTQTTQQTQGINMNFTNSPTNITALSSKPCQADPVYFSLMAVIHILTFVANFLTALAIWRLPGLEGNKYHLVVRTLVLSDCLISLSSLPMSMVSFIKCEWFGGAVACVLSAFFSTAFLSWSAMIVIVMCVMRFLAVKKPLFYRNGVTYTRIKKGLAVAFIWGVLHLVLPLVGLGQFRLYERGYYCALDITPVHPKDKALVYITVTEGCLVMTALVYFSIVVMILVKKKRRVVSSSLSLQQQRGVGVHVINKREGGFATMTFVIVLVYCICYIPFLIYRTVVVIRGPSQINEYTYYFTELVAHLNPLLNPVVYVACSRQYRYSIKRLFDNCCLYRLHLLMRKYLLDSYGASSIELRKMSSLSARSETTMVN